MSESNSIELKTRLSSGERLFRILEDMIRKNNLQTEAEIRQFCEGKVFSDQSPSQLRGALAHTVIRWRKGMYDEETLEGFILQRLDYRKDSE